MNELYTVIVKSDDNSTKFILTKEQLNKMDYFNFIDDLKVNENTYVIELEYTRYLGCISDLISLLNIKSDNYLSINHDINYYIKNENNEMINYYLKTNKIKLDDIITIKKKFLQNIQLKNPVHNHLWNIYNLGYESIKKFSISEHDSLYSVIEYNQHGHPNGINICEYGNHVRIFSSDVYVPVYDMYNSFTDINNVIGMIDSSDNLLLMKYDPINPNIMILTTLKSDGKNNYGVIGNRYYFTYSSKSIELYDIIDDKKLQFDIIIHIQRRYNEVNNS